jgi:hypothetical protein
MSEEKVLFEMRITEHGVEVTESEEWRAYHHRSRCGAFAWAAVRKQSQRPTAPELRRALDSLQSLYDDLYGRVEANA